MYIHDVIKISTFIHEQIYKWFLRTFLILHSKVKFVIEWDNKASLKKENLLSQGNNNMKG